MSERLGSARYERRQIFEAIRDLSIVRDVINGYRYTEYSGGQHPEALVAAAQILIGVEKRLAKLYSPSPADRYWEQEYIMWWLSDLRRGREWRRNDDAVSA